MLTGPTVDRARERALELARAACDDGVGPGCRVAAELRGPAEDATVFGAAAVSALYRRGCDLEDHDACAALARRYVDGVGVGQCPEKAAALVERARVIAERDECGMPKVVPRP